MKTYIVHLGYNNILLDYPHNWKSFRQKGLVKIKTHRSFRETQNSHFMLNNFFSENRSVYRIMWKIMVE